MGDVRKTHGNHIEKAGRRGHRDAPAGGNRNSKMNSSQAWQCRPDIPATSEAEMALSLGNLVRSCLNVKSENESED